MIVSQTAMDLIVDVVKMMEIIRRLTAWVPCHRRSDRCVSIGGEPFPICARCMSILLGFFAIPIFLFLPFTIPVWVGILLQIPMMIDGVTQAFHWRESNQFLRIITGSMSGIGLSILTIWGSHFWVQMMVQFLSI